MKYKILENPNCEDAYGLIEEALRKRATITIYACCKVNYEGRALSELNWGERIILIKPDLILESHRRTPKELLTVEIRKVQYITYANIEDFEELEQAGYEKDMGDMIMEKPHMIEEGFKPTAREYSVEHGFIDILGKDCDNNLMILELKARKAGVSAVKQLKRYLTDFEDDDNDYLKECLVQKKKIRGLLVAPSLGEDAKELIEKEGIEFVAVNPPKELKRDKKVTLDAF